MPETRPIRVLVGDDHPVVRLGLQTMIDHEPDMQVVAEAADGRQVVDLYREHRPDVTTVDLRMPGLGGLDAIGAIRDIEPTARTIVITIHRGDDTVYRAVRAGARGYVLKGSPSDDILAAIRAVYAGRQWIPSEIAEQVVVSLQHPRLTLREIEVLVLVARGFANSRIAQRLTVSESTVKNQLASIFGKLGVMDRAHAVAVALDRNILQIEDLDVPAAPMTR